MSEPMRLAPGQKQLFVDDLLIADNRGVTRTFWPARKFEDNPVVEAVDAETYLIRDKAMGKFRAINGGSYGESADGVRWEWPLMDLVKTPEGERTNLLFDPTEERALACCTVRDEADPAPDRRYKMIHTAQDWQTGEKYWRVRTSPDGLRWTRRNRFRFTDEGGIRWRTSDISFLTYDPWRRCFAFYCRCYHIPPEVAQQELPPRYAGRAVARATSTDLEHWSTPHVVMNVDGEDPPGTEVYHLIAFPYGSHWLGLWRRHVSWPHAGVLDVRFAHSRDGIAWTRRRDQPFIPLGEAGTWDRFNNQVASVPIRVGDELWVYYIGRTWRHAEYRGTGLPDTEYRPRTGRYRDLVSDKQMRGDWAALSQADPPGQDRGLWSALGIARLRLDGFASLGASFDGGEATTVPFLLPEGRLHVNVQSRWGSLTVEALDPDTGEVIASGRPLTLDEVDVEVDWPEGRSLAGRTVQLRFKLRNAQIYAFWVQHESLSLSMKM